MQFSDSESRLKSIIVFLIFSIFPAQDFSFLPLICMIIVFVCAKKLISLQTETLNFEWFVIFSSFAAIIAYIISGIIFSENIYFARLSFSFPLILYSLSTSLFLNFLKRNFQLIILLMISYAISYISLKLLNNFISNKAALISGTLIFLSLSFGSTLLLAVDYLSKIKIKVFLLYFFGICPIAFGFMHSVKVWNKNFLTINDITSIKQFIDSEVFPSSTYLVTNLPIGFLYGNVGMHAIQKYKGFINGVTNTAGNKFLLFDHTSSLSKDCVSRKYKYGLYSYEIIKASKISENVSVCLGTNFATTPADNLIDLDELNDEHIKHYLDKYISLFLVKKHSFF